MKTVAACLVVLSALAANAQMSRADGYRGIWYANQATKDEYAFKYSGGLATYCMKHIPMAVYASKVDKTFFVYGGTNDDGSTLLEMVSYYDHATGKVPRPTILMDKKTDDAHDNPVISLDDEGYVWVFASSHGTSRPSFIFRSKVPYSTDDFERVLETNFSYPQPWHIAGKGFLFLHTRYSAGRGLFFSTSADGRSWSEPTSLSYIGKGHYQVSWPCGDKVGTAFDYHPDPKGLNFRTNLYYMETPDMGKTWRTASGESVAIPLSDKQNPALVHDYESEGLLVYVKDVNYDAEGRPAILHVTSRGWEPGPQHGPHTWRVAAWRGDKWEFVEVCAGDNNYDSGSLYMDKNDWRIMGPSEVGPQAYNPGGENALWTSADAGKSWNKTRVFTHASKFNHGHVRRPLNAHPDFAAYWADGDARKKSEVRLYFCDRDGNNVRMLPWKMDHDTETPIPVP
jgi:hypothetical protein